MQLPVPLPVPLVVPLVPLVLLQGGGGGGGGTNEHLPLLAQRATVLFVFGGLGVMQVPFFGIRPSPVPFPFGLGGLVTFPFVATLMAAQSGRQTSAHPPLPVVTVHP